MTNQDIHAGPHPEGFPGGVPNWTVVPGHKLGTAPYNRICQVVATKPGDLQRVGTGWHRGANEILTAAHVVAKAVEVKVRFANETVWYPVFVHPLDEGYWDEHGNERRCSPYDRAVLVPRGEVSVPEDGFSMPGPVTFGWAIGFQDGKLVEHLGTSQSVGPFVAHNAHTAGEHSGCPILIGSAMRAIHVGLFSGSRPYLRSPQSQLQGFLNSAVRVDG